LRHSIQMYDTKTDRLITLTSKNGLPDEANTGEAMYYDPIKQTIAIGFSNAFSLIDISSMGAISPNPKVFITGVKNLKNGDFLDFNSSLRLKHKYNDVHIDFTISDLSNNFPSPQFEYRLSESDPWKFIGSEFSLSLIGLSPNFYKLQIRLAGKSINMAGNFASVEFRVLPPFHKTAWFYLSVFLAVSTLAFLIYRVRRRQILTIQNVRNKISSDLHDDLGSRLTNIRFLSVLGKDKNVSPVEKEKYLKKISEEALASGDALDEIVRNMKIHDEELEDIIARMRHYANSVFDNGITDLKIIVDENMVSKKLNLEKRRDLLLVFKEILNNIKKHAHARQVNIELKTQGSSFHLKVQDDGKGFETDLFTDRNGLKNVKSRINKWKGKVGIISAKRKGTTIDIDLPF